MGSAPSKNKKKNRYSSQSLTRKSKKTTSNNNNNNTDNTDNPTETPGGGRPRAFSETSVLPQIPAQWGSSSSNNQIQHDQQQQQPPLKQTEQRALEESVYYSPMNNHDNQDLYQGQGHTKSTTTNNNNNNNDGRTSPRISSGNVSPKGNTTRPRTNSSGLPSLSFLKSRKSSSSPHHRQMSEKDHHYSHRVIDISSPIIESRIMMDAGNYSRDPTFSTISTEQPVPPRKNHRRSLEASRFEQQTNTYVEPPKPNAGAYKAPVPSLPSSPAQPQQSSTFIASPSLSSPFDSSAVGYYPPPPGSAALTSSSVQDPHNLWKETTLRNANNAVNAAAFVSATAAEGRKSEPAGNRLSRSESVHSQNSRASSTYSSSGNNHNKNKGKTISGSTFATSHSPSPSNASQSSFKHRDHLHHHHRNSKTNIAHSDGNAESSRLNSNQVRLYLHSQQIETSSTTASENASTLSLPGSRYLGDNNSFRSRADNDSIGGGAHNHNHTSIHSDRRHASEISLAGSPVSAMATGVNTPSLAGGVRTPNDRQSQHSSPRHSTSSSYDAKRTSSPLAFPVDGSTAATAGDRPVSPKRHPAHTLSTRTANSSARESMVSVSTANYRWMEEQDIESGVQDAIQRDSALLLFPSPTTSDPSSLGKATPALSPTTAPTTTTSSPTVPARPPAGTEPIFNLEQMAQHSLEQQAQQHALLKYFFKGNYHAPLNKDELSSVLDVGCGAGLWMRDMALEFPLTEIHGVDAVVPTRKRRPRVPPNSLTPKTGSPNATPFGSKQSSPQGTPTSSANGSSSSIDPSMKVPPAMLDSMPSNCFFHKADTTRGLPFPDNTFDFCRVRLVLWGYNLNSFPDMLSELVRVTKKGGWIEFVDMDPCIKKANETGTRINEWIKTGLIHGNLDPDLVKTLPKFLREFCDATMDAAIAETDPETRRDSQYRTGSCILPTEPYGLDQLKVSKISLPFGSWGGKVGELWQQCFITFLHELEPLIMDATLSGLVMDQYHRQFQQEMQHRFAEAAAASEESEAGASTTDPSKSKERVTSFDQRLCTHLAWTNLINQLVKDATISPISLTNPASKAMPYSHDNFLSSVKEVRSYNNFYIAYAQKVDIVELKQQFLLSQLEQEILSPNLNMASVSTFPSLGAAAAYNRAVNNLQKLEGAIAGGGSLTPAAAATVKSDNAGESDREPVDRQSDTSHVMANTLIQKMSTPSLRQQFLASRSASDPGSPSPKAYSTPDTGHGEKEKDNDEEVGEVGMIAPTARKINRYGLVASLTQDALESLNQSDGQDPAVAVAVGATPPTPTSVAALSIRSSSRNSIRNNSISAGSGSGSATGPTASTSPNAGGGLHSPRIGYGGLRRQESIKSNGSLHSPQAQSATVVVVEGGEDEGEGEGDPEAHQQDYFSHTPVTPVTPPADHSSMYHQQQYHHHYQQQMNSVKRENSLLSTVVTPSALAAPTTLAAAAAVPVVATVATVVGSGSASATNLPLHSEGDEGTAQQREPDTVETLDVGPDDDDDGDDGDDVEEGEGSEILVALQDDDDIQDPGDPDPNVEVEPGAEDTIEIINQVSNPDHGSSHDRYQCPAEPVIKPVYEEDADADVESFAETPLGHLTPVEGGDDDDGFDSDEVVFVMMAPPGPPAPHPGPPPMHVAVPASDPGPQAPTSSSLSEAASVPLRE
ncbi:hypothetical protein EC957_008010 [Mortierella hygrophila]|uniref:Methyltransferase type 11 domain-containing protein n=1 Tax=Mortierella hygrophila TaxID=979708 RepID=A0A9P6FD52_9FUNG|nr:hypothetical protein EC957_008010 [Mortierella hygrophila]